MRCVKIFGFGSYFNSVSEYNDIDILLLHEDISVDSCNFALKCKAKLTDAIDKAHIVILSNSEETEKKFLQRSHARYIGTIARASTKDDFRSIVKNITQYR